MACAKVPSLISFFSARAYLAMIILIMVLSLSSNASAEKCSYQKPTLGAILECRSRAGREAKVGLKMAIEDFCANYNYDTQSCPTVLFIDSLPNHPFETAFLASTIIKDNQAKAMFLGLESWQNAFVEAELGNKFEVPILSLASDQVPAWAYKHSPFLLGAARSQRAEMKAVAAIIRSWQWKKVNVIYEDIDSAVNGIFPYLVNSIREVGSEISAFLAVPPSLDYYDMSQELESLHKNQHSRVFIVHTSSETLATQIFKEAEGLGMMAEDSVWIATTSSMNQIDSLDAFAISSMQGVVGVKSYFLKSGKRFEDFRSRFVAKYHLEYPRERSSEPGIFALQAYDAAWAVALALNAETTNSTSSSSTGKELLENVLKSHFLGFSGQFEFNHSVLGPSHIFEIVNVVGKSYNELGFWSEGLGFSKTVQEDSKYNQSMSILGQVFWPGGPLMRVPRGWAVPGGDRLLKIGVPARTTFSEFVNVKTGADGKPDFGGFSIEVFRKIVELLPYHLPYDLIPFNGSSYDSMVQQVQLEIFDGVVADTAIIAKRWNYAAFSQPYAESGLQMLIHYKPDKLLKTWLFLRPFTVRMWITTLLFNMLNGLVILLIERRENPEFMHGSLWSQMGTMLAMAFSILFLQQGPKLSTNSTRLAYIAWLLMCLILTSSFTASLTSLLTVPQLRPATIDIETLKKTGAKVGCDANSFVVKYLEDALGFEPQNIVKIHSEDEYPLALESGKIKAAFLEVPYVKLFLAKHCKNFTTSGQPLNVGGFGFAFSKKSSYLADISQAILEATESGKLLELERSMLSSYNCSAKASSTDDTTDDTRLDIDSFTGLFIVTGLTTVFALLMYCRRRKQNDDKTNNKIHDDDDDDERNQENMDQLSDHHARDHDHQAVDDHDLDHGVGENHDQQRSDHDHHDHGQLDNQTVLHVNEDPPTRG